MEFEEDWIDSALRKIGLVKIRIRLVCPFGDVFLDHIALNFLVSFQVQRLQIIFGLCDDFELRQDPEAAARCIVAYGGVVDRRRLWATSRVPLSVSAGAEVI